MSFSKTLPSVLTPPSKTGQSAISMGRALKQIHGLLDDLYAVTDETNESQIDRIRASIDDVEVMLMCLDG